MLKKWYKLAEDWEGNIYCGINLDWHYDEKYLDIGYHIWISSLYIPKELICFAHPTPKHPQHNPYKLFPKKYGEEAQDYLPIDDSGPLDKDGLKRV
jgi:hypothetical protein